MESSVAEWKSTSRIVISGILNYSNECNDVTRSRIPSAPQHRRNFFFLVYTPGRVFFFLFFFLPSHQSLPAFWNTLETSLREFLPVESPRLSNASRIRVNAFSGVVFRQFLILKIEKISILLNCNQFKLDEERDKEIKSEINWNKFK